jgi:hypothetical protein
MTGTLIDARTQFLMKALIDQLDNLIKDNKDWHSYCLHVEEDGEDYLELRFRDVTNKIDTVIDRATVLTYHERKQSGQPLFKIYG